MYLGAIDFEHRGRYAVNYGSGISGLGLFGSKKKKRRRAAAQAERDAAALRIANLEKMVLLKHAPDLAAPVAAAPVAPVVAPVGPMPTTNIPAPVPVAKAGLPGWAVPAGIGAALLLVAAFIIPQIKKAK